MGDLQRFHDAQSRDQARAVAELRAGRKVSHWMWYIFPQLASLGHSPTAKHYGIRDLAEARAYLADPVLALRLREAAEAMLANAGTPPEAVLGAVDAAKLRSCATLFREAGGGEVFDRLLAEFYGGEPDAATLRELG
ncbi:DUF1810 domain-containing protein [Paracoccus sp. Z118]|uniref:DUF1810 domain-containing protein n=1 Tax=Paracoccus sp. Z118 TaxID=2851017 RepID=UPI001C2BECD6|nr:DUF1810 domain-containing protein [Paracoccus sp. Z118]MBV0891893.1 DUF1810 domain-containing protein [Paracoccus sp. Z118]